MRDIKFRVWDRKKKKMYTPQKIKRDGLQISWYNGKWALNKLYTELKDKNGKEVYKGDIIEASVIEGGKQKGVVKFLEGKFIVDFGNCNVYSLASCIYNMNGIVIGNVYKNQTLLK